MYKKIKNFLYKNSGGIAIVSGVVAIGCTLYLFWSIGSQFTTPTFGLYATTLELTKALTNTQKIIGAIFLTNVSICAYAGEISKAKYNVNSQGASLDLEVETPTTQEETKNIKLLNEELCPLLNHYSGNSNNTSEHNRSNVNYSRPRMFI